MSISAFSDKAHPPGPSELYAALGPAAAWWESLVGYVTGTYDLGGEWKFYAGPKYGWTFWFRRGGRTLVCFYPGESSLTVQIVLNPEQARDPVAVPFTEGVRMYPEGCWLFLKVTSRRQVAAIKKLIALKAGGAARAAIMH